MTLARNLADLGNQVDSSGTLGIGGGGTSATNATAGFNALAPSQTSNTNKYLTTNGTNTSWADIVSGMTITSITYSGDDQAVDPTNPLPVTINGSNFVANSLVYIDTISSANSGTSINVTSSSTIVFTPPTGKSAASYNIWVVSPTGQMAILANGLLYSGAPSWAGQSTSLSSGATVSIQLTATGDTPLVYSLVSGTLPTGTTLSSSGLISGTATSDGTFPNIVIKATDPESQDASITIEITITLADDYFEYVTMLLHGDGANGVQNNTFVDSSTNNFTITRNGNTTQGSFSPYGSLWSNYFNGTNSYFDSPNVIALGSGNFTVEGWFNPSNTTACAIYDFRGDDTGMAGNDPVIQWSTVSAGKFTVRMNGTYAITTSSTFAVGGWYHVALVRNSGVCTLYVNGVSEGTYSTSTNFTTAYIRVGAYGGDGTFKYTGYCSNLRAVVGTAVYTTAFTPPTTPLTAISGTIFLVCQSNRFIDNSSNNYTLTITGTPSVQRFSPFNPTASYSTATIGGSGYFVKSTSDYLQPSTNVALGSSDFTIESWVYYTGTSGDGTIICEDDGGTSRAMMIYRGSNTLNMSFFLGTGSSGWDIINGLAWTTVPKLYTWNHFAAVRSGNNVYLYCNGVRENSTTISGTVGTRTLRVGAQPGTGTYTDGYYCDTRMVVGTALYTGSTYTVPTSPLTAVSNTQLLLNYTNAGIPDSAMMNDLQTVGNAQVSTSVVKFGTGSLAFDGNGDYLVAKTPVYMGTGNFTIEFWYYPTSFNNYQDFLIDSVLTDGSQQPKSFKFGNNSSGVYLYYNDAVGSFQFTTSNPFTLNTWQHIAFVKQGTTIYFYLDGVSTGTPKTVNQSFNYSGLQISNNGTASLNGYIDDFRLTSGVARYPNGTTFTPPTSAFPSY